MELLGRAFSHSLIFLATHISHSYFAYWSSGEQLWRFKLPTQDIEPFGCMWQYLLRDALRGNPNSDEVSRLVRDIMVFINENSYKDKLKLILDDITSKRNRLEGKSRKEVLHESLIHSMYQNSLRRQASLVNILTQNSQLHQLTILTSCIALQGCTVGVKNSIGTVQPYKQC